MEGERPGLDSGNIPIPAGTGAEWAAFVQQQVQTVLQAALPHFIQQVADRARPSLGSPTPPQDIGGTHQHPERHGLAEADYRESKVAEPERFTGKKGNEVYCCFAQLRLVFRGKPRTYGSDADKVAYALSYMSGAAQNWAMPLLQALDEGRGHDLLENYEAFRESVIGVYGDLDRRGNAEDRLGRLRQTGSVAAYISTFNEYAAQVDWNEASLVARFRGGLKDEVLDSVATVETQPRRLQDWMAMASRIDERLWRRRQARRPSSSFLSGKGTTTHREPSTRGHVGPATSGPVPMELGAVRGPPALAKTAAERLEY